MDEQGTHEVDELTLPPATVISRRRPKALWGVLAAVAVAAGALAVTSAGNHSPTPLLPIALGGGGGREAAPMAADSSFAAWVTYVAGDGLPALGGEAPAYRLAGNVDEAQVRALADALGVAGEVVQDGSSWRVSAPSGGTLEVYEGAGASWWYSSMSPDEPVPASGASGGSGGSTGGGCDPIADCIVPLPALVECPPEGASDCATGYECPPNAICAEPLPADPPVNGDCAKANDPSCPDDTTIPPLPPVDLPSEDEARAIALDVLAATGVDTDDAIVTVDGPYDAWNVTVEPRLDGAPSGLLANVSVGSRGVITSAGGFLGTPERLGDYPILDTRAAILRLNEQMTDGGGYFGGVGIGRDAVSNDIAIAPADPRQAVCAEAPDATTVPCDDTIVSSPTTFPACKVQADGSEICEGITEPAVAYCPQLGAPVAEPLSDDQVIDCPTIDPMPIPEPMPLPAPEPMEVVLTGATPTLVLIPANDGSADAYLVPGYRFTGDNGEQVDAPAVADDALSGPATTEPPVTDTVTVEPPAPDPGTDPSCETLVEEDSSGTTHTIQPCAGIDPTETTSTMPAPGVSEPTTTTIAAEG